NAQQTPKSKSTEPISGILLSGPPGCGKGTVGNAIGKFPGIVHCSSGDMIRSAMSQREARDGSWDLVANGALIDDRILWELFDSFLLSLANAQPTEDSQPPVI